MGGNRIGMKHYLLAAKQKNSLLASLEKDLGGFAFPRSLPQGRVASALRFQLNRALVKHDNNSRELIHPLIGIKPLLALWVLAAALVGSSAATISPLPDKVSPAVSDRQDFQTPDRVRLTGWVGLRIDANEANRLVKLDPARLLEGYRKRPGRQSWDGEHVGKWLHAATLAWVNTGDPALRASMSTLGWDVVGSGAHDFAAFLDVDLSKLADVARMAGVKAD